MYFIFLLKKIQANTSTTLSHNSEFSYLHPQPINIVYKFTVAKCFFLVQDAVNMLVYSKMCTGCKVTECLKKLDQWFPNC